MSAKPKTRNPVAEISKGVILAVIIAVISAGIYAILIQRQTASEASVDIWGYVTLGAASLAGCLLAAGRTGEKRMVVCLITAAIFAFVLLAFGILFFDGGIHKIVGNLIAIFIGGLISCFLSLKRTAKKMKIKMRSR